MTPDWPYPFWIAHRGAGKLAPENTLASFRLGAAHGYRCFECDVKLSSDDVPFLLHDADLQRTASTEGAAGAMPWTTLSALDAGGWHSARYVGEPLPSLARIAAFVLGNAFTLNLEIKPSPGAERRTGEVVAHHVQRLWAAASPPPLLSSFKPQALAGAMAIAPELPRALLLDTLWDGWQRVARELACVAVICNHRLLNADTLADVRREVSRVLVYTVNQPDDVLRMKALGVDGVITDAIDRFKP